MTTANSMIFLKFLKNQREENFSNFRLRVYLGIETDFNFTLEI